MKQLGLFVVIFLFITANAFSSEYAVVDLQKVINTCDLGKGAKSLLKVEFASYDSDIMLLQNKLKKNKSDLDAMQETDDKSVNLKLYTRNAEEYKKITQDVQSYLDKLDKDYTRLILDQSFVAVQKYNRTHRTSGSQTKYVAVFEKNEGGQLDGVQNTKIDVNTINLSEADDITEDIIMFLDNNYKFSDYAKIFKKKIDEHKYKIEANF